MQQFSNTRIFIFTLLVCLVCAVPVSLAAVSLRPMQERNQLLDKKRNILQAAQLIQPGEAVSGEEVLERFKRVEPHVIELASGTEVQTEDPANFDEADVPKKPAPANPAQIQFIPEQVQIFEVVENGKVDMLILPITGKGLWSTMLGFIALDAQDFSVRGITYYKHGETPGLGGEVDNPRWKALWPGRKVFGENNEVRIEVIKGSAGPASADPYRVDGLSGATITSRGVQHMLEFWLGENGYGPFLENFKASRSA